MYYERMYALKTTEISVQVGREISEIQANISEESIECLVEKICQAKKIFVSGAGRSLLMLRGFAMRLMHIGFDVYVVGDTITPAYTEEDLLILGSASGETSSLINQAKKAKKIGGIIALVSIFEDSSIAEYADLVVKVPAYTDKLPESEENKKNILPGGSMFEICMLVLFDSLIIPLGEKQGVSTNKYFDRHANLE